MLQEIKSYAEYSDVYNKLSDKINEAMKRDDMIIFDQLNKCLNEIILIYPQFEAERRSKLNQF